LRFRATVNYEGHAVPYQEFDLEALEGITDEDLQQYFEDKARQLVQLAREFLQQRIIHVERSTGRAERSIGWTPTSRGITFYIGAPYGGYIEKGTSRGIEAKRFMEDAIAQILSDSTVDRELNTVLHGAVNRAAMRR
jgi:hypothetical protein